MADERRIVRIDIDGASAEISARRLEQALASLDKRLDPLGVATQRYNRDVAYLKAGLDTGAMSVDQHAARVTELGRQYDQTRTKLSGFGRDAEKSAREATTAWDNLAAGVSQAAKRAVQESEAVWNNLATGIGAAAGRAAKGVNQAWSNIGRGVSEAAREALSIRGRYESIAASLDPAIANTQRLTQVQRDLDKAVAAGVTTMAERNRLMAEATRLNSGGLSQGQRSALPGQLQMQANDIVGGLLTGQQPMTVFLQQAPQVAQAFGGWGAALRALVSPAGLAAAAVLAVVTAGTALVARASSMESAGRQIGVSLRTMGGAQGLTVGGVQAVIDQQARQPGFGRVDTTAAARQLQGNRDIRGEDYKATLDLAREFALVNKQELPAALDALVPKLTGGAEGLRQLDKEYGLLTASQLIYIDSLERQGRQQDITRIGIEAMSARFKGEGVKSMSEFSRAVDDAGKVLGGAIDNWVRNDPVIKGILKTFSATASAARQAMDGAASTSDAQRLAALEAQRADILKRQAAYAGNGNIFGQMFAPNFAEELKKVQAAIDGINTRGVTEDILKMGAAYKALAATVEDDRKKLDALLDRVDPFRVEVRNATSDLAALAIQLPKAFASDQARQALEEFTARLDPFVKKLRETKDAAADLRIPTEFGRSVADISRQYQRTAASQGQLDSAGGIVDPGLDIQRRVAIEARTDLNKAGLESETLQAKQAAAFDQQRAAAQGNARALAELSAQQALYTALLKFGTPEQLKDFVEKKEIAKEFLDLVAALRTGAQAGVTGDQQYRLDQLDKEAASLGDIEKAYLASTDAGRNADIMHRAWMETTDKDVDSYKRLTEALYAVDDAQRRVEGAKLIATARDEARYETMLTDALRQGVDAYDRATIAVKVLREVEQGRFQVGSREAEAYRHALQGLQTQQDRQQAIQTNRQYDPAVQLRYDLENLEKLARTGELSARAYEAAWTEAYIRAGQASDSWVDGARAGLLEYARDAQQAGRAISDVMVRAFTEIENAMLGLKVDAKSLWEDIRRISIRQNITGPLAQMLGGGLGGQTGGGNGGVSMQQLSALISAAGSSGGGASGGVRYDSIDQLLGVLGRTGEGSASSAGSSGAGWLGMLGMGGGGGGGNMLSSFLSLPIFGGSGTASAQMPNLGGGAGVGDMASQSGGLMGLLGGSGGGLSIGGGLMGFMGAFSGIQNAMNADSTVGKVGGGMQAAGAVIGMIPTPWTKAIGMGLQVIGSILPLFAPPKDVSSSAVSAYDPATGKYSSNRVAFAHTVSATPAPEIGNNALATLKAFGGSIAEGRSAPSYYVWQGDSPYGKGRFDAGITENNYFGNLAESFVNGGAPNTVYTRDDGKLAAGGGRDVDYMNMMARRAIWTPGGTTPLPYENTSTDSAAVMKQLSVLIMKLGVIEGSFTGLSDTSKTIIRNFTEADPDKLAQSLAFGRDTYDVLIRPDIATQSEEALKKINDNFKSAIDTAKDLALATDRLVVAQRKAVNSYASDFNQSISDRILGNTDPAALQRVQLDREFDQLRKDAAYLNEQYAKGLTDTLININDIEKAYGLEREKIVSQSMQSLLDLERRIRYGDLSAANPLESLAGALGTYKATAAQALAGDSTALAQLPTYAEAALNAQVQYSGNNTDTADLRAAILSVLETVRGANSATLPANDEMLAATLETNRLLRQFLDRMQAA